MPVHVLEGHSYFPMLIWKLCQFVLAQGLSSGSSQGVYVHARVNSSSLSEKDDTDKKA